MCGSLEWLRVGQDEEEGLRLVPPFAPGFRGKCPGTRSPSQQGSSLLAEGTSTPGLCICSATVKKYLFVVHLCQPRSSQEKVKRKSTRFSAGKRGEVMEELGEGARGKPAFPPPRLNQEGLVVLTQQFGALPCPCACGWSCW